MDNFLADVEKIYNATGKCLVVVSEGIHDKDGNFISEAKTNSNDGFGHAQLGGLAARLAEQGIAPGGAELTPNYLRLSQAERERMEKQKNT